MKRRSFMMQAAVTLLATQVKAGFLPDLLVQPAAWQIKQFKNEDLAHFSYAVVVNQKIILIDPSRNPAPYYGFAEEVGAKIVGVIETHPHADFISSHKEIHEDKNAVIYASKLVNAKYKHTAFDQGDTIVLSDTVFLKAIQTPGHSPDSISVILVVLGKDTAVFSGDALLFGDVGRPDLRENSTDFHTQKKELAGAMYDTIHTKFAPLADDVILYPAHGAGSLCGNSIREATSSTVGYERKNNYAFENRTREAFIDLLLADLPFIPKYFPYDVALNKVGAAHYQQSKDKVKILADNFQPIETVLIIDTRPESQYKQSYIEGSVNLMNGSGFETWLGSVVDPESRFYLIAENQVNLSKLIDKSTNIGYETNIAGAFVYNRKDGKTFAKFNKAQFIDPKEYTIIDVRTDKEAKHGKLFRNSINIPLPDLVKRKAEIPTDKPIIVHCASGYRSAAGSSILKGIFPDQVIFDMGTGVKDPEITKLGK